MNSLKVAHDARLILQLQAVLILGVGVAYLIGAGRLAALAALYGGAMALLGAWSQARRVRLAAEAAKSMPGREVGVLYRGAIQRFLLMFALFIVGIAVLEFEAVPLLVGFAVPQGAFLLVAGFRSSRGGQYR